ncbi:hypothetical protein [Brevundimonas sp. LM2]|uniref:hypothetical protein n=1 Tax=Brevundimonas sp. LM2 TaxID=1938605 RepID=UPI0012377CAC|nr:hypothetical protein [Brevundimonas sp. LM2]
MTACLAVLSLAACATPPAPDTGGSSPDGYALADLLPAEAPALARQAAAWGDHRLIGFIGIVLVFPGADAVAADRLGYRVIDAGGDSFTTDAQRERADRAYAFAERWNTAMLATAR